MIKKLKQSVNRYRILVENFSYLTALQFFNIAVPLLTFPYLIRVLGASLYGEVIFAQTITTYFSLVISFGFDITATKEVSINRDNKKKLSTIVSSIIQIKTVLWFLSLLTVVLFSIFLPSLSVHKLLLIFSFSICFNEFLFPQWYFQGIEKMKYITIINLVARLIFLSLIFLVVNDKSDYLLVPLLNGIGAFIGGILGLYIVFKKEEIKFSYQPTKILWHYVKDSLPIFTSNLVISIKDRFNIIFIGMFLGMDKVAVYDIGVKVMNLIIQPIILLNNSIYPKVAKDQNMIFVKKIIKISFVLVLGVTILLQPVLSILIELITGKELQGAINVTRILLLSPILFSISMPLSRNCIIVFGKYRLLLSGMILTTLFYLLLIVIGSKLNLLNNVPIFAAITVSVFIFELVYRLIVCVRLKLLK